MWPYALSALAIAIFNLLLFSLTFRRHLNAVTRAYFTWSVFVTLWSLGYSITLSGFFDYHSTLLFNKLCQAMAVLIGPFFFRLANYLSDDSLVRKRLFHFYLGAGIIIALLLFFTDWFVKGLWSFGSFRYQPKGGPLYFLFVLFFIGVNLHGYAVVFQKYRLIVGIKRKQLQLFLISTGIGYGLSFDLFLQGLGFPVAPHGIFFMFCYVIILGYAIHKYKFLDIPVLIRKTVVFAGLLAFVFGVFSAATLFVRFALEQLGATSFWTYAVSLFFIVLGYDPIRNILVNLTDRYLFQKKYDYQKLLKDATKGLSKIESLDHLMQLVAHFITMKMRVKSTGILSRDFGAGDFELGYQRGYEKRFLEYHMGKDNPLMQYLDREKEAIDIERVKEFIEAGGRKKVKGEAPHEYDFQSMLRTMQELEAACCVPSFLGKELRNILIIGEKKSGHYYTNEDLNVLFTLAQESAIAIENARLYDEAIKKRDELKKTNEQLEYSKSLLMKALRETEVANKKLQDTQAQLIHEQKMATLGRLAASVGHEVNNPLTILSMNVSRVILKYRKDPNVKIADILDLFQKMEQNIARIKAVVNTLTGLLKKSEKGKFEPLSLKLILEETLPLVQFQTYLENLTGTEVEFDIPGNLPLVRGDLERLQEVFLNLFINAYHAMAGRRNRRIRVKAEVDPANGHQVAINFKDNGCGMTEEVLKKIFNYGFTTKPPGKGSGMGLYMCKYILEIHGGDIKVLSKAGEGTTFSLTLPIYEEGGLANSEVRAEAVS